MERVQKIFIILILFSFSFYPAVAQNTDTNIGDNTYTNYEIYLQDNGNANWSIGVHFPISENQTDEFQSLNPKYLDIFEQLETDMKALMNSIENETNREMSVHSFERTIEIDRSNEESIGIARLNFKWENFGKVKDSTLSIGDAFIGGFTLGENETLIIHHPEFEVENISPEPTYSRQEQIGWRGPYSFNETANIVFSSEKTATGPPVSNFILPIFVVLIALASFIGGIYASRRINEKRKKDKKVIEGNSEKELLTDEDRVIQLLKGNGGKMKQSKIVKETEWSKSKVSTLLSGMEEEEKIKKLRLGRENIIELKNNE